MNQASSEARSVFPRGQDLDHHPGIQSAPSLDATEHGQRIRARRVYSASTETLFDAWTHRAGWEAWLRLRSRSRATISACPGGAFRLELAEGPKIHVISGSVIELVVPELLSLSWTYEDRPDRSSLVTVSFEELAAGTELTLVHDHIASRRDASWLMRLWTTVLDRLGEFAVESDVASRIARYRESTPPFIILK